MSHRKQKRRQTTPGLRRYKITNDSGIGTYLKEIGKTRLLTPEEERELAHKVREGDPQARDLMTRANLRLVVAIAKGYTGRGLSFMDLIEEGNLGLLRAVEAYDPEKGVKFSTYAAWWIKQAIKRALLTKVKTIRIPAYMVEIIARLKTASAELGAKLGRQPTVTEVAKSMKLHLTRINLIRKALAISSYGEARLSPEALSPLVETLANQKTRPPVEEMFEKAQIELLERLLNSIDQREALVLRLRYGLSESGPLTLREIGERLNLTRERIRQIENEALGKLNTLLTAEESIQDEIP